MCSCYHAEELLSRGFAKISVHFSKKLKQTAKRKKFAVLICRQQAFWGKQKAALPGRAEQLCFAFKTFCLLAKCQAHSSSK
jgi:hypothetical protein